MNDPKQAIGEREAAQRQKREHLKFSNQRQTEAFSASVESLRFVCSSPRYGVARTSPQHRLDARDLSLLWPGTQDASSLRFHQLDSIAPFLAGGEGDQSQSARPPDRERQIFLNCLPATFSWPRQESVRLPDLAFDRAPRRATHVQVTRILSRYRSGRSPCSPILKRPVRARHAGVGFIRERLGSSGGTGTCPDGSTPLEHSESGCIPANCGALKVLNWGVPTPEVVSIPKFDSGLGTLLQVELTAKVRHAGNFCVDNTSPSCAVVDFTPSVQVLVTPNASLPGVQPISVNQAVTIFTPGFNLGGMDGIDDCATPTGPMSIGNCAPGEDHFITQFDENYSSPPTLLMTAAQLAPWINTPGGPAEYEASVRFDAWAQGIITGSGSSNVDISVSDFARLELEAKYIYCPNMAPDCVPANPGYTVSENPIAANNSININLMDLVSDMDGCIDCSTFQITQQPLAADAPLSTSCTGLGDLINPKAGCTTCTTCIVTYTRGWVPISVAPTPSSSRSLTTRGPSGSARSSSR